MRLVETPKEGATQVAWGQNRLLKSRDALAPSGEAGLPHLQHNHGCAFEPALLTKPAAPASSTPCPCGSGQTLSGCCGRYLGPGVVQTASESIAAPDAEALMRSRYTAYVLGAERYLLETWHPDTRPAVLNLASDRANKWLGLSVKRFEATGPDTALVEFVARYKVAGRAHRLHEISRFVRENGRWLYCDGTHPSG